MKILNTRPPYKRTLNCFHCNSELEIELSDLKKKNVHTAGWSIIPKISVPRIGARRDGSAQNKIIYFNCSVCLMDCQLESKILLPIEIVKLIK